MFVVLFRLPKEQIGNVYIWVLKTTVFLKPFNLTDDNWVKYLVSLLTDLQRHLLANNWDICGR